MSDPYSVLGVSPDASDSEVRAAYRRQVKLHHPDHNGGSPEAARRFEAVQDAYARVQELRVQALRNANASAGPRAARAGAPGDPELDTRLADLERQVREARQAREAAQRAAREAAAAAAGPNPDARTPPRPSDEELGYVHTDDTIWKILDDARSELSERLSGAREHPAVRRVGDLIDGLEELADKLERPRDPRRRQ